MTENQLTTTTTIELDDIEVMCVVGDSDKPIPEQAPSAFQALEASLGSLRGRKFYGIIVGTEYRACVALTPEEFGVDLPNPVWVIPGGKYARRRVKNWNGDTTILGLTFEELAAEIDHDDSRPSIEFYRRQDDLILMVPIK